MDPWKVDVAQRIVEPHGSTLMVKVLGALTEERCEDLHHDIARFRGVKIKRLVLDLRDVPYAEKGLELNSLVEYLKSFQRNSVEIIMVSAPHAMRRYPEFRLVDLLSEVGPLEPRTVVPQSDHYTGP